MATSKTDGKAGAAGRRRAARPIPSRPVAKRAPESRRGENESPMTPRRPVHIEDELSIARSDRSRDSDDDFGGSER